MCSVGLPDSEPRVRVTGEPQRPEELYVHGPHAVIVRTVAAAVTHVLVHGMYAVLLTDVPAFRTPLGRVVRLYLHDLAAGGMCLIRKVPLKLVEGPCAEILTLLLTAAAQGTFIEAHARKVFEHEQRAAPVSPDECLRYPVVNVGHPAVLSSRDAF